MINARAETIAEKPFFKQCLAKRRCLIPADGFYEWRHQGKEKIPMHIHLSGGELFAFAGLYDQWHSPTGEVLRTCTIITCEANEAVSPVHDRMPVIVRPELEATWLDESITDTRTLFSILQPYRDDAIAMHQVSSQVNSPALDLPELAKPVA
jgi:putative SOS response-associated peptidase YedK